MLLGLHWMAQGKGCDQSLLADKKRLVLVLEHLVRHLELTSVREPLVHQRKDDTLMGIVLLAESHASIHLQPAHGLLYVDVFSCSLFRHQGAAKILQEAYLPATLTEQIIKRGQT